MTNYKNGYVLESAVKKLFEANGYFVIRAGGSKGPADLVALKRGETVLVQCKLDGYLPPVERKTLSVLAAQIGAEAVVGSWWKRGREARRVHLAGITDVGQSTWLHDWSPDWALEGTR